MHPHTDIRDHKHNLELTPAQTIIFLVISYVTNILMHLSTHRFIPSCFLPTFLVFAISLKCFMRYVYCLTAPYKTASQSKLVYALTIGRLLQLLLVFVRSPLCICPVPAHVHREANRSLYQNLTKLLPMIPIMLK